MVHSQDTAEFLWCHGDGPQIRPREISSGYVVLRTGFPSSRARKASTRTIWPWLHCELPICNTEWKNLHLSMVETCDLIFPGSIHVWQGHQSPWQLESLFAPKDWCSPVFHHPDLDLTLYRSIYSANKIKTPQDWSFQVNRGPLL